MSRGCPSLRRGMTRGLRRRVWLTTPVRRAMHTGLRESSRIRKQRDEGGLAAALVRFPVC